MSPIDKLRKDIAAYVAAGYPIGQSQDDRTLIAQLKAAKLRDEASALAEALRDDAISVAETVCLTAVEVARQVSNAVTSSDVDDLFDLGEEKDEYWFRHSDRTPELNSLQDVTLLRYLEPGWEFRYWFFIAIPGGLYVDRSTGRELCERRIDGKMKKLLGHLSDKLGGWPHRKPCVPKWAEDYDDMDGPEYSECGVVRSRLATDDERARIARVEKYPAYGMAYAAFNITIPIVW